MSVVYVVFQNGMDQILTCGHTVVHVNVTMQAYVLEVWKLVTKWSPVLKGPDDFFYSALPGNRI